MNACDWPLYFPGLAFLAITTDFALGSLLFALLILTAYIVWPD